jgi:hypothetical protein
MSWPSRTLDDQPVNSGGGATDEDYRAVNPHRPQTDVSHLFTPHFEGEPGGVHIGHVVGMLAAVAGHFQGWNNFRLSQDAQTVAGAAVVQFETVRPGWEWLLNRISVSVAGASAAATAAVFVGAGAGGGAPDESYLVDFAAALLGNSPSRNVADYPQPLWLTEGDNLTVAIAGAAAGTNNVFVRIEGRRRERL